jgi:hypothetical protein
MRVTAEPKNNSESAGNEKRTVGTNIVLKEIRIFMMEHEGIGPTNMQLIDLVVKRLGVDPNAAHHTVDTAQVELDKEGLLSRGSRTLPDGSYTSFHMLTQKGKDEADKIRT